MLSIVIAKTAWTHCVGCTIPPTVELLLLLHQRQHLPFQGFVNPFFRICNLRNIKSRHETLHIKPQEPLAGNHSWHGAWNSGA